MNKYFKNYESFTKTNDFYINTNEGIITNGVIFIDLKTMEYITPLTSIKESFFLFEKEGQGILSDIGDAVKSVGGSVGGVVSNLTSGAIKALTPQGTSEWLHFTADTISMILDFIPLGLTQVASFVIDIMNGGSYFIETEFYPAEKIPLTIAGLLTLGFASVPALGNEAGIASKQAIKSTIKNISKTSLKDFVKMGIKKGSKKESEFIAIKLFKGIFNFLPKVLQKFLAPVLKWIAKGASFVFDFITKKIEIILKTASAPFKYILEIIGFGKLVTKLKGYISKSASKEAIDTIAVQSDVFAKGIDNGIPVEKIEAEALTIIQNGKNDVKQLGKNDIKQLGGKIETLPIKLDSSKILEVSNKYDVALFKNKKVSEELLEFTEPEIVVIGNYTKDVKIKKILDIEDAEIIKEHVWDIGTKFNSTEVAVFINGKVNKIKNTELQTYLKNNKVESIKFVNYCNENLMSHKNIISILLKRYVGMNFMHWWNAILTESNTVKADDVIVMPYIDSEQFDKFANIASGSVGNLRTNEQKQAIVDFCKYINDSYKFTNPTIIQSLKSIKDKENNGIEQDETKYLFDKYENIKPFIKLFQAYINNIVKPTEPLVIDGVIGSKTLQSAVDLFTTKMPRKGGLEETNKLIDILQKQ